VSPDPVEVLLEVRCIDHQHVVLLEPVHQQVVDHAPVLEAHRRVLGLTHLHARGIVDGNALNEVQCAVTVNPELAHVGDVEQPGSLTDGPVLGGDPRGILHRHLEAGERDELGVQTHVLVVERRTLQGRCHAMSSNKMAFCT
jgi:hypothetical protein